MRSTPNEGPRRKGRSLLRRVMWSSIFAAAGGAAFAATTGGLVTLGLLDEHEEKILRIATLRFAKEIEEEQTEDNDTLLEAFHDELDDLDHVGSIGAVREGGVILVGDETLPVQPPDTCAYIAHAQGPLRACTVAYHGREITLAISAAHTRALRPLFGLAALLAVAVGTITGALLGRRTVGWGLGPFVALRDQVRRVKPEAPASDVLSPPTDYVEIEEVRRAIVTLVDRLGASISQAQRFAAQASHELRTPLTAIAGEVDLLAETAAGADAEALRALQKRIAGMTRLIERLLVLAVPSMESRGEAVDLGDVANEVQDALSLVDRPRLILDLADDVIVRGDPTLLRAALANAVENALKFSSDTVEIRVGGSAAEVWMEVEDRGPGVSAAEREAVFAPFYRAPAAKRDGVPGSGIGLALIAHVAQTHGGRAEFVDVPRGACLRVTLPRWTDDPA